MFYGSIYTNLTNKVLFVLLYSININISVVFSDIIKYVEKNKYIIIYVCIN